MADFRVEGAEDLAYLARRLKEAGDKDLQRKLYAGLNRAVKPLRPEATASLSSVLPKRGGLAARKRRQVKFRVTRRAGARQAGIRFVAVGGQVGRMDRGGLRHPIPAGREFPWVTQRITPGWFTRPTEAAAPVVRREIVRALDDVARELDRRR